MHILLSVTVYNGVIMKAPITFVRSKNPGLWLYIWLMAIPQFLILGITRPFGDHLALVRQIILIGHLHQKNNPLRNLPVWNSPEHKTSCHKWHNYETIYLEIFYKTFCRNWRWCQKTFFTRLFRDGMFHDGMFGERTFRMHIFVAKMHTARVILKHWRTFKKEALSKMYLFFLS